MSNKHLAKNARLTTYSIGSVGLLLIEVDGKELSIIFEDSKDVDDFGRALMSVAKHVRNYKGEK